MFSLLLAAASVATAPPAPCDLDTALVGKKNLPPHASYCNTGLPPQRFQDKDSFVAIQFKRPLQVHVYCSGGQKINGTIFACTESNVIGGYTLTMPNPCEYASEPGEYYAVLLCHELGHVAGWPDYHGD